MSDQSIDRKPVVLIIEDEAYIMEFITKNLTKDGFNVCMAETAQIGLTKLRTEAIDAVVLDLRLPDMDGFEFCRRIRRQELIPDPVIARVPILMLTARTLDEDILTGFEVGADDYLTKPFNPLHLAARLKAIIRRAQTPPRQDDLRVYSLQIDLKKGAIRCGDKLLDLAPIERKLLLILASHPEEPFSRETLLQQVWDWNVGECLTTRTVDVQINRLRKKLTEADSRCLNLIETMRGIGYVFHQEPKKQ